MTHNRLSMHGVKILTGYMLILLMFSCSKDIENSQSLDESNKDVVLLKSRLNSPNVANNLSVFSDISHFEDYYKNLNRLYDADYEAFKQNVPIGRQFVSVHTKMLNDNFSRPEDRYQPFLSDPIMAAIVNEYFEFEIGTTLVTYMNNSEVLISDSADLTTQQQIRTLSKGVDVDLTTIPTNAYLGKDTDMRSFEAFCGCSIEIEQISCDEVKVSGTCRNFTFGNGKGKLDIVLSQSSNNPFNGPINPVVSTSVNGSFCHIVTVNSTIPVYIHARINPRCFTGNTKIIKYKFEPGEGTCDESENCTGYLWAQDSGVQGYSHKTSYYENFIVAYSEAKVWSYYYDGDRWKANKKDLDISISERRMDDSCNERFNDTESESCNCKVLRVRKGGGWNSSALTNTHCDGDVTGTYQASLNWNGQSWTIDAIGDVDFECCE